MRKHSGLFSLALATACIGVGSTAAALGTAPMQEDYSSVRVDAVPATPLDPSITVEAGSPATVRPVPADPVWHTRPVQPRLSDTIIDGGVAPAVPVDRHITVDHSRPTLGRPYSHTTNMFTCESQDHRLRHCHAPPGRIVLQRQLSRSACVQGRDWDVDHDGVWVTNGCRARFSTY